MQRVVINRAFGAFSISKQAAEYMAARGHQLARAELEQWTRERVWFGYGSSGYRRDDPLLVQAVEALGDAASGSTAQLAIVDIPDGVRWTLDDDNGREWISEAHRLWLPEVK